MVDDVVFNKIEIMERCLKRINEEYNGEANNLSSRDDFDILVSNSIIEAQLAKQLKAMVGFRNIAVHNYQELKLEVIEGIIKNNLNELLKFGKVILDMIKR